MLRVIEYLTKSLKVIGNDALEKGVNPYQSFVVAICLYLVPFLRYST